MVRVPTDRLRWNIHFWDEVNDQIIQVNNLEIEYSKRGVLSLPRLGVICVINYSKDNSYKPTIAWQRNYFYLTPDGAEWWAVDWAGLLLHAISMPGITAIMAGVLLGNDMWREWRAHMTQALGFDVDKAVENIMR